MPYINDLLEAFLQDYYAVEMVPSTDPLSALLVTYLDENPDGIADMTARFKKLIADAEAA